MVFTLCPQVSWVTMCFSTNCKQFIFLVSQNIVHRPQILTANNFIFSLGALYRDAHDWMYQLNERGDEVCMEKATCGRVKDEAAATGFAFCCSKRCDGFFNEASPSAGKWTKSVVAVAEQIGNSFVCKNYHGLLFSLPPSLSLYSAFPYLCYSSSLLSNRKVKAVNQKEYWRLFCVSCLTSTTVHVRMSRGYTSFWLVFICSFTVFFFFLLFTEITLKTLKRGRCTVVLWLTNY